MRASTAFFVSPGRSLRPEFVQIVQMLTGNTPSTIVGANEFMQSLSLHTARKLPGAQQASIRMKAGNIIPLLEQIGVLGEVLPLPGPATVFLLGARLIAILKRLELLIRCTKLRDPLVPDGPVVLMGSRRLLEQDELDAIRLFPHCAVPSLELPGRIIGPQPTTEGELMEALYRMVFERHSLLQAAHYHMCIHDKPSANTEKCAEKWISGKPRHVGRVVGISGPQPWGIYQGMCLQRVLQPYGYTDVGYAAYAGSEIDTLAAVEALAKSVFELAQVSA